VLLKQLRQETQCTPTRRPEPCLRTQDRFNELHALLSAYTNYLHLLDTTMRPWHPRGEANLEKARAVQMLENSKVTTSCLNGHTVCKTRRCRRINTAVAMIGLDDPVIFCVYQRLRG